MDFMNKVSKALNKATEKAGELTQQAKLKVDEQKLKNQISTKYKQLGEKIYFTKKEAFSEEDLQVTINQYVDEIDLLMDALNQLAIEMDELTKDKEEAEPEVEAEVEKLLCINCGIEITEQTVFCPSCGTKQA